MGKTPVFKRVVLAVMGVFARSAIVTAMNNTVTVSRQSSEGLEAGIGRGAHIIETVIAEEHRRNAIGADKFMFKVNISIGKEITANPITNDAGNRVLIEVKLKSCKDNSPVFVNTAQAKVQYKTSQMLGWQFPSIIIASKNMLIVRLKIVVAPYL